MAKACRQFEPVMVSMLLLLRLEWDLNLAKADLISSFKSEIRISTIICLLSVSLSLFFHLVNTLSIENKIARSHSILPPIYSVFFFSRLNNLFFIEVPANIHTHIAHRHKGWKAISSILVDNSVIFPFVLIFVDLQITNGNQFEMVSTKLSNKLML